MRIVRASWVALLAACTVAAQGSADAAKAAAANWLLPNFAYRLSVEVSNPGPVALNALATVPVARAAALAPLFPGRLAIAILTNPAGAPYPGKVLPSQSDDLDGDGTPDQFEFPVRLGPGEHRRVDIYYSTTLDDRIEYPKQVQAKHSYGYNHQTAAIESELIGYRTYGGFFLDVQARMAGNPGLYNDVVGYLSMRHAFGEGRDVFHIGDTLGLGGIFLRRDGVIYQPPMNVPDYAHKPSPEMVPHYRVIAQGPLRAIIEAVLDRWEIGGDIIRLRAQYAMDAGESFVRCRFEATPVHVEIGHVYDVGIGIRDLPQPGGKTAPGRLIVTGEQDRATGPIGLAIYFDPATFPQSAAIKTSESTNRAVLLSGPLRAGEAAGGEYAAAAAWSRSGAAEPGEVLDALSSAVAGRVVVSDYQFARTPRPDRVDAEAQ